MAFSNTKPHMSLLLAISMTCFLLLLNQGMSADLIIFKFQSFPNNSEDITFRGDAIVTDGALHLTKLDESGKPDKSSAGQAVFGSPIHLWESSTDRVANISTTFDMVIRQPGDRITFFLISNGGNLGTTGPTGSNPDVQHYGIDINCLNYGKIPDRSIGQVKITYSANSKQLTVSLSSPNAPGIIISTQTNVDFTKLLPEWVQVGFFGAIGENCQVGFSGATGDNVEIQQIRSWFFSSDLSNSGISEDIIEEVI